MRWVGQHNIWAAPPSPPPPAHCCLSDPQVPTSIMLLDTSAQPRPQMLALGSVEVTHGGSGSPDLQHVRLYDHFGK